MHIKVNTVPEAERKPKPKDESSLKFGELFTDHYFSMKWNENR